MIDLTLIEIDNINEAKARADKEVFTQGANREIIQREKKVAYGCHRVIAI